MTHYPSLLDLANKTVQETYHKLILELKQLLKSYPIEYRTYIIVKDANVGDHADYCFFNPLVAIQLSKSSHDFYLNYTLYPQQGDISERQWLDVTQCILKHTAKESTAVDIEDRVGEDLESGESYYTILKEYHNGIKEHQPQNI